MKNPLGVFSLLIVFGLMSGGCPAPTDTPVARAERREDLEYVIRDAVNAERRKAGIPPLELRHDLRQVAISHNLQMIAREQNGDSGAFDHRDASGHMVEDRLELESVDWAQAGENLARNRHFDNPAREAMRGWLASPEHRRNMLNPRFDETGIAVHRSLTTDTVYFTQVFVLRMPE